MYANAYFDDKYALAYTSKKYASAYTAFRFRRYSWTRSASAHESARDVKNSV
jgi:hypothetical protein